MMRDILALCLLYAMSSTIQAQQARVGDPGGLPSIREHTSGMTKSEGYLTFYYDNQEGNLWLEISRWNQDLLYGRGLATGVGLRSLSLDRGQITGPMLVQFQRFGRKVFLVGINSKDRTTSNDEDQQRSVKESFSHGVLWGFTVAAEEADTVLVDATSFFLRDAFDVVSRLQRANAGNYSMDLSRSAINPDRTKNFPNNTEVDSIVTFTGKPAVLSGGGLSHPGRLLYASTSPSFPCQARAFPLGRMTPGPDCGPSSTLTMALQSEQLRKRDLSLVTV